MSTKVRINYKSGQSVIVKVDDLTVKKIASDITGMNWDNMIPRPLHVGIDEIESVWEL